jgi:hypothetical protein
MFLVHHEGVLHIQCIVNIVIRYVIMDLLYNFGTEIRLLHILLQIPMVVECAQG